jgi:uncharacterized protein
VTVLLSHAARIVERRPALALALLAVLTVVLGGFATQQTTDPSMSAFAPQSDLADADRRIADEFGSGGATMQIVVDATDAGDALAADVLAAADDLAAAAETAVGAAGDDPPVVSYSHAFADADPTVVLFDPQAGPAAAGLLSSDLDAGAGGASGGLVVVRFAPHTDAADQEVAELAVADAVAAVDLPDGVAAHTFGEHVMAAGLMDDMERELPLLMGLAFLLVLAILSFTYRRVGDVAVGLAGLVVVVVWTYGVGVLLGPHYLGITGHFTQIAMVVPVLLIGLGIDYAIHLTSRYREEAAAGNAPPKAAAAAVGSVGGALLLATATTVIGFLTNVASPLPPIRDFGIFVAGGVVSAFVVMLLLVPSVRALVDGRRAGAGRFVPPPAAAATGLGAAMSRVAVLAERHAKATLAVAAATTLAAGAAGLQVSTEFSQDDFVPDGSDVAATMAAMDDLFGGDLEERTHLLLDGDLTADGALTALHATHDRLGDVAGVRDPEQATSPWTAVAALAATGAAEQAAALGLAADLTPASDVDAAGLYLLASDTLPDVAGGVVNGDATVGLLTVPTVGGQDGAETLAADLKAAAGPLEAAGVDVTVVSDPLVMAETLDALTSSQTRGIVITLLAALLVVVGFFTVKGRRPLLGVVTMVPSAAVVCWVLGSMWLLGLSFNVMTAMVASLAIGIGVPFGIHISHRFVEDLERHGSVDEAVRSTVTNTGGALLGSAATTAAGFGVLAFAGLEPIRQFGLITALTIVFSLAGAVLIEPACLKLWAERRARLTLDAADAEVRPQVPTGA